MEKDGVKTCTKCGEEKELTEFLAKRGECKGCRSAYQREHRAKNIQRIRIRENAYAASHREYFKENSKRDYRENKARYLAHAAVNNPKRIAEVSRSYCASLLGVPTAALSQDLYEAKRFQILIKRHLKEAAE